VPFIAVLLSWFGRTHIVDGSVFGGWVTPAVFAIQAENGFNQLVTVVAIGLPQGVTSSPSFPLTLTAGQFQEVTFFISSSMQTGSVTSQFQASGGGLSKLGSLALNVEPVPVLQTYQDGSMLYMQTVTGADTVRIGLLTTWGGTVTEFSLNGVNYVNANDPGREVQAELWDGNTPSLSYPAFWGTVQAGDHDYDGSPLLAEALSADSIYIKTQPLHWLPEDFGGGTSNPVPSDVFVEQWLTPVPNRGRAFKLHYKITHFGTDSHGNSAQECPAVYVNRGIDTFQYYGGSSPWTYGSSSNFVMPDLPQLSPLLYTPERWGAYVDSSNSGLTVYTPSSYPYSSGFNNPGPSPDGTNDFSPFTVFTFYPGAVLEFDTYLIAGPVSDARAIIYELHHQEAASAFSPFGVLEEPQAGDTLKGTSASIAGWTFGTSPVSNVQILMDGTVVGSATYGLSRPDVASAFPGQSTDTGFQYSLDTTKLSNGQHAIVIKVTDTSGKFAIFPTAEVNISNP
jgi:hypothetical protein